MSDQQGSLINTTYFSAMFLLPKHILVVNFNKAYSKFQKHGIKSSIEIMMTCGSKVFLFSANI